MHSTTLRGIFPEPKPACKRNFIKENMRHIKVMQGLVKDHAEEDRAVDVNDKYRNKPPKVSSNFCSSIKSHPSVPQSQSFDVPRLQKVTRSNRSMNQRNKIRNKSEVKKLKSKTENKFIEAGVQTERVQDIKKLYDNGLIIYPSPCVVKELETGKRKQQSQDHGDNKNRGDELSNQMKNINLDDKDYIKENILALKQKAGKRDVNEDPTKPPANYQKGVLPKYLKDRKEEQGRVQEVDPECPPGHVLLPEEERKETLRVLRQSYADRIQELNSMPVRNDTLRMRKRKVEIEEELKKIDEGIKVFQRPKVFVKINA